MHASDTGPQEGGGMEVLHDFAQICMMAAVRTKGVRVLNTTCTCISCGLHTCTCTCIYNVHVPYEFFVCMYMYVFY